MIKNFIPEIDCDALKLEFNYNNYGLSILDENSQYILQELPIKDQSLSEILFRIPLFKKVWEIYLNWKHEFLDIY